jgi:putative tricarboxylic transport membrane protein
MRVSADLALGLAAIALAGGYWSVAADIPDSLLSDAVGARGFPAVLAAGLAGSGALLAARGLVRRPAEAAVRDGEATEQFRQRSGAFHAAIIVLLLIAYVMLTPHIGYPAGVGLLVGATAAFAGARGIGTLLVTSVLAGLIFWVMFAKVLGISMPAGTLFGGV